MRYVSIFSGIEAATVAWSRLGWEPLAFAEVDEFPSAVLAHRFPDVPNLGDVCKVDWKEFHRKHGAVDVLIGGSPCQSFSIAGGREGLEGESRLMYEYIRAVRDLVRASGGGSPRYIIWENVPGCLSSNKGRDFGCLLDELEECGYFVAWRTLDSQFARVFDRASGRFRGPVPQRRRRVFLVGSLGGPSAADILFERQSLRGNHPKGREAREALAEHIEVGAGMGDSAGFKYHAGKSAGGRI
jgi:DNA (cytosine-5)-methyltransferase 1